MRDLRILSVVAGILLGAGALLLLWPSDTEMAAAAGSAERGPDAVEPTSTAIAKPTTQATDRGTPTEAPRESVGSDRGTLIGRLVQNGQPIPGARIEVWSGFRQRTKVAETTCGTDGAFSVALEEERVLLLPFGDGLPLGFESDRIAVRANTEVDVGTIHIPRCGAIRGRLVDEAGQPVGGIRVLHSYRQGRSTGEFDRSNPDIAEQNTTVSGEDGRFRFDDLAPGAHFVLAESPVHDDREARHELGEGDEHDLGNLVLREGRELFGRVFDREGNSVAGALVCPNDGFGFEPHVRKGVRTGPDGTFHLRGVPRHSHAIAVLAEDFEPWTTRQFPESPAAIALRPALVLRGQVTGAGAHPATVTVEVVMDGRTRPASWTFRSLMRPHPTEADGRFEIHGLSAGNYKVTAEAEGLGRSEAKVVEFDEGTGEIALAIQASTPIEVVVRDDLGAPVPGAEIRWGSGSPGQLARHAASISDPEQGRNARRMVRAALRKNAKTNTNGVAQLAAGLDTPIGIAVSTDQHVEHIAVFDEGAPARIEVALERAGGIAGRVADPSGRDLYSLRASVKPANFQPDARNTSRSCEIDAQGRFEARILRPGQYRVGLNRYNLARYSSTPLPPTVTPLLGHGDEERGAQIVDVIAGCTTEVELETPELGSISGKVTGHGQPIAGAIVFATEVGAEPMGHHRKIGWDGRESHQFTPHMSTGPDGTYRFLYASPGRWEFRVRHPDAVVATPPVLVEATDYARHLTQDLALGGATIRGRFDPALIEAERVHAEAYLFRADDAAEDAFYSGHHSVSKSFLMKWVKLEGEGYFSFPHLPEGDWVLRIVNMDSIVMQLRVHTEPHDVVDVGSLEPPVTVDAEIACDVTPPEQKRLGVWLRDTRDGPAMFVRAVAVTGGRIELPNIVPGIFEVELFEHWSDPWSMGISGTPTGDTWTVTIHADGTTTPERLTR